MGLRTFFNGISSFKPPFRPKDIRVSTDKTLSLVVFILLAAGFIMVYSSSFIYSLEHYKDGLYFFKRHLLYSLIGLAAYFYAIHLDPSSMRKHLPKVMIGAMVLLALPHIPGIGLRAGGATRWINMGFFALQPSELSKIAVIFFVAIQLSKKTDRSDNWRSGLLAYFLGALPIYLLLLKQPDFGTVGLLLCTTICMLFGAGQRLKYFWITLSVFVPTTLYLILSSPYRKARLMAFIDPWSDPAHKGFQIIQSFVAFFEGGWLGVGLGNSKEKLFYLPEAHNDFIFSVVGEELGMIGVAFFVTLFLTLAWRGFTIAEKLPERLVFERSLAIGITSMVGLQAFFNMGVVLGLLPTKGMTMPLISYGGNSIIVTMFLLGVLSHLAEKTDTSRT